MTMAVNESSMPLKSADASSLPDDSEKTIKEILHALYESDKYKDIIFTVAKTDVPANEIIVKIRSSVLKAKLDNPGRTSTDKLVLDDQNVEDFKKFVQFLYTFDCEINGQSVLGLFLLGKKYDVPALSEKCIDFFDKHLTKANAQTYAVTAVKNPDLSEFLEKCLKIVPTLMDLSFFNVDKYGKPTSVFPATLILQVLQQERDDDAEEALFAKVYEWAKHYCRFNNLKEESTNIKEAMKDLIPYIRFGNLDYATLAKVVRPNKLLSTEELLSYFCNKSLKDDEDRAKKQVAPTAAG